jgi:hypothetical protein
MAEHDGLTADKVIDAVLSRVEVIPEREGR